MKLNTMHEDDYRQQFSSICETIAKRAKHECSVEALKRRLPILKWAPNYTSESFLRDCVAGITVGLTAIPQGIANAVIADLPPQYGLYSAFVSVFVYIFLGSCSASTVGPTALMAVMTQPYVTGRNPDFAVLLTFLSGCITFLFGVLNLGFLVQFFSAPVISGFTTASALTIASAQIKNLFGFPGTGAKFLKSWGSIFKNAGSFRFGDTVLGLSSLAILFFLKKLRNNKGKFQVYFKYISLGGNALVDIGGAFLGFIFYLYGVKPFLLTGDIATGIPNIGLPPFSTQVDNKTIGFEGMMDELGYAPIAISFISILEAITIATIFCDKNGVVDATQEMIAIGAGNIVGSFFSSMPVTASFTRSAINNASGVRSPLAGLFTGSLVLLALLLLTSTFYFLPKATLAAVIISAMIQTMEFKEILHTWRTKRIDVIPLLVTLLSCLFIGLEEGILLGVAVNIFILLYTNSRPSVGISTIKSEEIEALVLVPDKDINFLSIDNFRSKVTDASLEYPYINYIIIDGMYLQTFDVSAAKKFVIMIESMKSRGKAILLWNWNRTVSETLIRHNCSLKELLIEATDVNELLSKIKTFTVKEINISAS